MQVGLHLIRHDAQKLAAHIMALAEASGTSPTHNRDPR
jgi:hypothetical protein